MLKTITLIALATFAFGGEADAKKPSFAEEAYSKVVEANSKDAFKAYQAYQDSLTKANEKIVKALEGYKKDLNDTKKGSLSLTERADAIKEIDGKIAELKKGALAIEVVTRCEKSGDLLGENISDLSKNIIGKWDGDIGPVVKGIWTFNKGGNGDFKGFDSNANTNFNAIFSWVIEEGKIKVDIDNKHKYYCYITLDNDTLSGSAWISPTISAKKIKK